MATVQARHERNDPNAGMQGAYYTVDIAMSAFLRHRNNQRWKTFSVCGKRLCYQANYKGSIIISFKRTVEIQDDA